MYNLTQQVAFKRNQHQTMSIITDTFYGACETGDIEVAKQELLKDEITSDIIGFGFRRACYGHHFELAKMLLFNSPIKASIANGVHRPIIQAYKLKADEVDDWRVDHWIVTLSEYHTYGIRYNENGLLRVTLKTGIYSGASFVGTLEEAQTQLNANPIIHRVREILELVIVFYSLLEKNEIYMLV
jgi:hypothetical protein